MSLNFHAGILFQAFVSSSSMMKIVKKIGNEYIGSSFKKYKRLHNKNYKSIRITLTNHINSKYIARQILQDYLEIKPININLKKPHEVLI